MRGAPGHFESNSTVEGIIPADAGSTHTKADGAISVGWIIPADAGSTSDV